MTFNLTLLCPSFERHHYLERSCRFWGDRSDVFVLYADGSQSPLETAATNAPNLRYLHQPIGLKQRLLGLLDLVHTPYVCMMGDDEFYIPSSLQNCVEFLESHSDYVSCMGRAIGFSRLQDKIVLSPQYPRLRDRDLSDSGALNRLESHFSPYVPAHSYAVTRTEVFRAAMQPALANKLDVFAIGELIHEFLVVAAGKSIVLPVLYWLRSHEAPPLRNTGDLSLDPSKRFDHWWQNEKLIAEKKDFCQYLSEASCGSIDAVEVEQVFNFYVDRKYGQASGKSRSLSHRLKQTLPDSLKKPLRLVKARAGMLANHLGNPVVQSNAALQELRDQGVMIDDDGLAECHASIKESWRL